MENLIFDSFLIAFANGYINLTDDSLMLTLHSDSYIPDVTVTSYNPDTLFELSTNGGYTRGGKQLQNQALVSNLEAFELHANDVVWSAASFTARYAILWDSQDTYKPIAIFDLGENITALNESFIIEWPDGVIFTLSTEVLRFSAYESWLDAGYTGTPADFIQFITGPQGEPGEETTASNVGTGIGVYETKTLNDLKFKTLVADSSKLVIINTPAAHTINLDVDETKINHSNIIGGGVLPHSQIDTHLSITAGNPHGTTKTDLALGNVPNVNATIASNITQDETHRFVSDSEKSNWNGKENTVNKTASFQVTPDDIHFPTEKLVKDNLDLKVDKVTGKALSTNDYTTVEQSKLAGIEDGAEVNVQADWNATTGDAFINNKPTIPDQLSDLSSDSTHRTVTDAEKSTWNNKVDKVTGKGLSTNDYTTAEQSKLSGIASGAEVNVQSDWNAVSGDAFILNKPTVPTALSDLSSDSTHRTTTDAEKSTWNNMIPSAQKGAASGVATLDTNSKIPSAQLPAIAITDVFSVDSQAAMLALTTADVGDVAIRSDISKCFILSSLPYSTLANWKELLAPASAVTSVDGRTAVVTLSDLYAALSHGHANAIAGVSAGFLSASDKTKLDGVASGAQVNVQSDWNATAGDAFIVNKPASNLSAQDGLTVTNGTGAILKDGVTIGTDSNHVIPTTIEQSAWNNAVDDVAEINSLAAERNSTGLVSGGIIYPDGESPITFNVTGGIGYIVDHVDNISHRVVWDEQFGIPTVGDGVNYFYVNVLGQVEVTLLVPNKNLYLYLGSCYSTQGNTVIIDVQNNPNWVNDFQDRVSEFASAAIRSVVEEGCEVSEQPLNPLKLHVNDGWISTRLDRVEITPNDTLIKVFATSDYGFVPDTGQWYSPTDTVNTTHWNDVTKPIFQSVIEMTDGYWKKDLIAIFPNSSIFYVYGQEEFLTETEAKQAPMQYIPGTISVAAVYLAFIISRKGDTSIADRILDLRPNFARIWGLLGSDTDSRPANPSINLMSTGLLNGGILSINSIDDTKFDLSAGNAIIVDNTDILNPTYTTVNWDDRPGLDCPSLALADTCYIRMNSTGVLSFHMETCTDEERRDYIEIGWLDHPNRTTIEFAKTEPFYNASIQSQLNDFIENFGPFNVQGNEYSFATGLQIQRSEGKVFDGNSNYSDNIKDPHVIHTLIENPCDIYYYYRDGSDGWVNDTTVVTAIDPNHYDDDSGTLADVPAGKWTIQTITYYSIYESNDIQYGQALYDTYTDALAALYNYIELNPYNIDDVFRCWLLVKQGAIDLTNIDQAVFLNTKGRLRLNEIIPSGAISSNLNIDTLQFNTTLNNPAFVEGKVFYDKTKHALSYYNDEADITLNIGQENIIRVRNATESVIPNGSVVYPSGSINDEVLISLANAHDTDKCRMVGVVTHEIGIGESGYVTKFGEVGGLNTSGFTGGVLYLSDTPGQLTQVKPINGSYITQIGAVKVISATEGSIVVDINTTEFTVEASQTLGFSPNHLAILTFTNTSPDRTLTLTPVSGTEFDFYQYGTKYTKTTDFIQITDEEGLYVIYYDLGVLHYIKNPTVAQTDALLLTNPIVCYVYWNAIAKQKEYLGYELHQLGMNVRTKSYLHQVLKFRYISGLTPLSIIADGSGALDSHAQFGIDLGQVADEDLFFDIDQIVSTTGLPIKYLSGTYANPTLRTLSNPGFAVSTTGTGRLAYNRLNTGTYSLAEVSNNDFVCCHVIAANSNAMDERVFAFLGQAIYTTVTAARAAAQTEIATLKLVGILPQEVKAIATFVFQTSDGYANAVKARVRSIASGVNYVDFRNTQIAAFSGTVLPSSNFNDSIFEIFDDIDNTKVLQFNAANITTGTTKTLSAPNATGTILVSEGVTGGQILKGGVLTSEAASLYNNAVDNQGITIEADGTLSTNVVTYETLVLNDNDIPNRKFVTNYAMANRELWTTAGAFNLPTIHDDTDGSVTLGSGDYNFYTDWGVSNNIEQFTIAGANYPLTDNALNYIVGDYNTGTPIIRVTTNPLEIVDLFNNPLIPLFSIYKEGTNLNIIDWDEPGNALAEKLLVKDASLGRFDRQSGLTLTETPTRVVVISDGLVWHGVNRQSLAPFQSDQVDNVLSLYYHSSPGVWAKTTITQYTNNQYDDGSGLQTLLADQYVVIWVYRAVEAHTHAGCVYSTTYSSLAAAQISQPPSSLPGIAVSSAIFVGRIIIKSGEDVAAQVDSAFTTAFTSSSVSSHSDLSNRDTAGNHAALIPLTDSVSAIRIYKADGTTPVLTADTLNNKILVEDINVDNLTASLAVVTDANKNLSSSGTTAAELGYLSGVTSAIQSQFTGKEPANTNIQSHIGVVAGNPHGTTKNDLSLGNVDNTSDANKPISTAQQAIYTLTKEPTGFKNPELVVVTYSQTNMTFSLTGTVEAYYNGVLVPTLTNTFVSAPHPSGKTVSQWLYYDGTFKWADAFPGFDVVLIAVAVYYGAVLGFRAIRECHGLMPWLSHQNDHLSIGAIVYSGGLSSGITLANTTASLRRPVISDTVLLDEDLFSTVPTLTSQLYTHHWLTGTSTVPISNVTLGNADIIPLSTNRPYYNQLNGTTWQQTLMSTNGYTSVYVIAMPATIDAESQAVRYLFCLGQNQNIGGNTTANATALAAQLALDPANLNTYNLNSFSAEWRIVWQYVIKYNGTTWTVEGEQKIAGTKSRPAAITGATGLSSVSTDASLSGAGTIVDPLAIVFETTASEIQMNGIQAVGNNVTTARGDHVHPVDTSREAANVNIQSHIGATSSNPHGVSDATLSVTNVTDNNVSTTKHGFAPIAPNVITQFLSGDGTWRTPSGSVAYREFTFVLHRGDNATTGVSKTNTLIVSGSMSIIECYAYAKTAPTGASLVCDINKNGTTIWTTQANRIAIASGNNSGNQTLFDITTLAENDLLTIDIDSIGSTVAGSDITVVLKCTLT